MELESLLPVNQITMGNLNVHDLEQITVSGVDNLKCRDSSSDKKMKAPAKPGDHVSETLTTVCIHNVSKTNENIPYRFNNSCQNKRASGTYSVSHIQENFKESCTEIYVED